MSEGGGAVETAEAPADAAMRSTADLSVKVLKRRISEMGGSYDGYLEKQEFIATYLRLRESNPDATFDDEESEQPGDVAKEPASAPPESTAAGSGNSKSASAESNPAAYVDFVLSEASTDLTILGLTLQQSKDEKLIKRAYHNMARVCHPDKNADPRASEAMQRIQLAFRRVSVGKIDPRDREAEEAQERPSTALPERHCDRCAFSTSDAWAMRAHALSHNDTSAKDATRKTSKGKKKKSNQATAPSRREADEKDEEVRPRWGKRREAKARAASPPPNSPKSQNPYDDELSDEEITFVPRDPKSILCMFDLAGNCRLGDACPTRHMDEDQAERLRYKFSHKLCWYGADCRNVFCVFYHPPR